MDPPRFEYDVFVSASQRDTQPQGDGEPGLAPGVVQLLDLVLAQRLGRKPAIWFDILGAAGIDPQHHAQVLAGSAVMLVLLSPAYLASAWCRRELQQFVHLAPPVGDGQPGRLFLVHLQPVEPGQLPAPLAAMVGYHADRTASGPPGQAAPAPDADARRHLLDMVHQLARDMARQLKSPAAPPGRADSKPTPG